jgi:hypothetical protein
MHAISVVDVPPSIVIITILVDSTRDIEREQSRFAVVCILLSEIRLIAIHLLLE